jgi:hypothetical protein
MNDSSLGSGLRRRLVAAYLMLACGWSWQSASASVVEGTLVDPDGHALKDVRVIVQDGGGTRNPTTTDDDGHFRFSAEFKGKVSLFISGPDGLQSISNLNALKDQNINLVLTAEPRCDFEVYARLINGLNAGDPSKLPDDVKTMIRDQLPKDIDKADLLKHTDLPAATKKEVGDQLKKDLKNRLDDLQKKIK